MPIYEYKCAKCGVFEITQRITENALKKCPTCKGKVERIISATSFILKGSGWYVTDYGRAGAPAKTESSSESGAGNGSSAKTETSAKADGSPSSSGSSTSSSTSSSSESSSKPSSEKSGTTKSAD